VCKLFLLLYKWVLSLLDIGSKHLAIAIIASPSLSPVLNDSPSLIHVGFLIYACIYIHSYVCMNMGLVSLSLDEYICVCVCFSPFRDELELCRKFSFHFFIRLLLCIMPAHWYSYACVYVCTDIHMFIVASALPWDSWLIAAWRLSAIAFSNLYCLSAYIPTHTQCLCTYVSMYIHMYINVAARAQKVSTWHYIHVCIMYIYIHSVSGYVQRWN